MNRYLPIFSVFFTLHGACTPAVVQPPAEPVCGNDVIEKGEECDGSELGGATCANLDLPGDELRCDDSCNFDPVRCNTCAGYPCGMAGANLDQVLPNLSFTAASSMAEYFAGDDGVLDFMDLYARNELNGGDLKGIMIFVATGWCPYCGDEADLLPALYNELQSDGILILGLITEDEYGYPADREYASSYGVRHNWNFPVLAGALSDRYWPIEDRAEHPVPFHIFIDARDMSYFGRMSGASQGTKLLRYPLAELAAGPRRDGDGHRIVDFDCAPDSGDETEPNDPDDGVPEDASALPYALAGTLCEPTIFEGPAFDFDGFDLGTLTAGTVLDISMTPTDTGLFPLFQVVREGPDEWFVLGPSVLRNQPVGRQLIVDQTGQYILAVVDGRMISHYHYGEAIPPEDEQCCDGGPTHSYQLEIDRVTLEANQAAIAIGDSVNGGIGLRDLDVYPLAVTSGTSVTVRMTSADGRTDPKLALYNDAGQVMLASGVSTLSWTADRTGTVLVVAGYVAAIFGSSDPAYTLTVE